METKVKIDKKNITHFAWLSIGAALVTISLKSLAYYLSGSVGLLSDAMESGINLIAAVIALRMLKVAAKPPDAEHAYGHGKAAYFSSGLEGAMIFVAALSIGYTATGRLLNPQPLDQIGIGLLISLVATAINLIVSRILLRAAKNYNSIILEADGHHLMTDVWTSVGVVVGVSLVLLTGWTRLDAIVALLVSLQILWSGWRLINRSIHGLLDVSIPDEIKHEIVIILENYARAENIRYHSLQTRQAGAQMFISVHILVPGAWSVQKGHDLIEKIEVEISRAVQDSIIFTHLEPIEDPVSYQDIELFGRFEQ